MSGVFDLMCSVRCLGQLVGSAVYTDRPRSVSLGTAARDPLSMGGNFRSSRARLTVLIEKFADSLEDLKKEVCRSACVDSLK